MATGYKTIKVSEKTYRGLVKLGTLHDTFDTVIARLLQRSQVSSMNVEEQRRN